MQGPSPRNLQQFILWKMAPSECFVLQIRKWMQIWRKVLQVDEQPSKRSEKNGVKSAVAVLKLGDCMKVLLSIKVTEDQGNLVRNVVTSWNEDLLNIDHRTHDNWVAYFRTWRRRSLFSGSAQTRGNQSSVWSSQRILHVIPKFEDQNPSFGFICPGEPHQRSLNAPKFEDRFPEETDEVGQKSH